MVTSRSSQPAEACLYEILVWDVFEKRRDIDVSKPLITQAADVVFMLNDIVGNLAGHGWHVHSGCRTDW